jgi:DnaA family protein
MSASPLSQLPLALRLRPSSTFASFVAGGNGLLLADLMHLSEAAQGQIYLWGSAGSGRTHLLEACVHHRPVESCFLAATELVSLDPAVLQGLEQYRLVVIDDVDTLRGEPLWEEALFHLYNRLQAAGGAVVYSAATPPAEAGFRLPDLSSRLAAGPVYRLQALDDDGLIALLQGRSRALGLEMPLDVARYLLTRSSRSTTALVEVLDRLDRQAMVLQRRLTIPFVRSQTGCA